jgi:hypothetical protein
MPLLKKGAKTLEREALKAGLNIVGDVVKGRHIKQAAKSRLKSTGESYGHGMTPWTASYERTCQGVVFILERILLVFYSAVSPPLFLFRMAK